MSAPIPTTEPASLNAGDTARWLKSLASYPASAGWVLTYTLVNPLQRVTFNATPQGDDFLVNAPAATTAAWPPGVYDWRATVTLGPDVFTVSSGRITIAPAFGSAVDTRSSARKALEAVEAYMADPTNLAAAQYEIAGRSLQRHNLSTLVAYANNLRVQVAREDDAARIASGLQSSRRIYVRFGA